MLVDNLLKRLLPFLLHTIHPLLLTCATMSTAAMMKTFFMAAGM
jgi:hypothetical protein